MRYLFFLVCSFIATATHGQDFYDLANVQTIEITFAETNWDALLDAQKSGAEDYIQAQSISINGIVFDSVGVKYKGNSSYNANQVKNPWHIELDTYKNQDYEGYTDIKLANSHNDPSFVRDVLGFHILRQYMDAPLSNYANLYVNGNLIGLYVNTESITKTFAKDRFGSKNNAFFNCSPPAGAGPQSSDYPNLVYMGQDSTDYYDSYGIKSDEGWQELIDLCDTLSNNINDIEKILDVDRALWMLAFDNVIVNLDSYIGNFKQNYYLYRSDYDQFLSVVWDLNESFGRFSQTGTSNLNSITAKQQMDHLLHFSDADFPLVQKLLNVPMYERMYLAHYKTILLENFDNNAYYISAQTFQSTIASDVAADGNKTYSYNDFVNNLTTDIGGGGGGPGPGGGASTPGITNLMDGRTDYLLGLTDFTQVEPTISNIALSNSSPAVNETITIAASIANEVTVYLGYRSLEATAPFTRIQMYDDGAHNDGAANDGIYGVDLVISNTLTQYYIYAENNNAGMFSPQRAEYEYYTINATITTPTVGALVINEIMASNDLTAADQDGEFEDWIELYNNSSFSIDVSGYFLSDDATDLMQWSIPDGTIIPANGYLIIWADNDEEQVGLHANFKLSSAGESIYLLNSSGAVIDQLTYTIQTADISYARFPNGTGSFQIMAATFNAENTTVAMLTPSFAAIFPLCQTDAPIALPTISQEGITGSWSPAMADPVSGSDVFSVFTPDINQNAETTNITILVTTATNPSFTNPGPFVSIDPVFSLVGSSLEGITGSWSPSVIDPSAGVDVMASFTPDAGQCAWPIDLLVSVTPNPETELELQIMLEGPYLGNGLMRNDLRNSNLLPLNQPYDQAPYNYLGNEFVIFSSSFDTQTVDWVLVELREGTPNTTGTAPGTSVVETKAGLLLSNGDIVTTNGNNLTFDRLRQGNDYWILVRHRNHLDILSATEIVATPLVAYDFTQSTISALGIEQLKDSGDGFSLMLSGDYNQDAVIQTTDFDTWKSDPAILNTYKLSDGNLDGVVQTTDFDEWQKNKAKIGLVEIGQ